MACPNCNSTDLKKLSLIYAAGVYESRGSLLGALVGSGDGLLFGRYREKSQSRLSKLAAPPKKMPYVAPTILWLMGFFVLMAFIGRGKLSGTMGLLSISYLLLLPVVLAGNLAYNLFFYTKKHRTWERKFMCQCCGAI